ncbi:hypothetical protein HMPREF9136_1296 [Prevotella dentalis DSM 3688]|uniref:Uncharacterized protein n=1 Tax=Prevotella dentalis (strain ATCC 49559 / DSM 3688 / JCM 13448 / NCTC 12043 / ES 2772) TaxID=908937 RepID=F9D368_PREDD|nr:hypothetical protein HMPREF9136_1296 [Prevotella dentalis DSM 3688]
MLWTDVVQRYVFSGKNGVNAWKIYALHGSFRQSATKKCKVFVP